MNYKEKIKETKKEIKKRERCIRGSEELIAIQKNILSMLQKALADYEELNRREKAEAQ